VTEMVERICCAPVRREVYLRYRGVMFAGIGAYAALLIGGAAAISQLDLPQWADVALGLSPILPMFPMLGMHLRFLRQLDDLQLRLHLKSLAIGTAVVALACFAYGLLEGVVTVPRVSLTLVLPGIWLCAAIARSFSRRLAMGLV
jgi:hypothetical protein